MAKLQNIIYTHPTKTFETVLEARTEQLQTFKDATTTVEAYDAYLLDMEWSETYSLTSDKSGFIIHRVWPNLTVMQLAENTGRMAFQRRTMGSDIGWGVTVEYIAGIVD